MILSKSTVRMFKAKDESSNWRREAQLSNFNQNLVWWVNESECQDVWKIKMGSSNFEVIRTPFFSWIPIAIETSNQFGFDLNSEHKQIVFD